jgi:hypothetical protein
MKKTLAVLSIATALLLLVFGSTQAQDETIVDIAAGDRPSSAKGGKYTLRRT